MKSAIYFASAAAALATLAAATTAATATPQAQDAPKPVAAKVTAATIFLSGAELTATAPLDLKKGANEITIEGLSPQLDAGSIRVNIGGGVVVSAFEHSTDFLSTAKKPDARLKMLRDSIEIYSADAAKLQSALAINEDLIEYLGEGVTKSVSGSENGMSIDELRKTMDYYKSKSDEIEADNRALRKKRNETQKSLNRVRNQYNQESGASGQNTGVLKLNLSAPATEPHTATITYFTHAASWSPYYDVNATSTQGPIAIAAKSRVRQNTGVDWENVRLTLSTSAPSSGRVAPLFTTWFLREKPQPVTRAMADMAPSMKLRGVAGSVATEQNVPGVQNSYSFEEFSEDSLDEVVVVGYDNVKIQNAEEPVPAIYDHVSTQASALNVTYNIDLPYTIPGNGKVQNIDLAAKQTSPEYKYYCAPRLDGATYLIAEIADWEKLDLLSAPAYITYDGTYIGETSIDAEATREKLTLTMGTDKRVAVTREAAREFTSTRAIGSSVERTFTWRLTVRNGQTAPVAMVLKDQFPVSTDSRITVALNSKTTTPWTAKKDDTGVVTWEETLQPGEVKVYTLSYTVKHPKDMTVEM